MVQVTRKKDIKYKNAKERKAAEREERRNLIKVLKEEEIERRRTNCAQCKAVFVKVREQQLYCSDICRYRARNEKNKQLLNRQGEVDGTAAK